MGLLNYNKNEVERQEFVIKEIANSGAKVVICGTSLSELLRYYSEKYGLMIIHSTSKFELRRICQLTNSHALVTNGVPNLQELGIAKKIQTREIGRNKCIVFEQDSKTGALATIILRGASTQFLDDMERAVDDGVN